MRKFGLLAVASICTIGADLASIHSAWAAPGYDVGIDVALSPKAKARLAALGEKIEVGAYWMGDPAKNAPKKEIVEGQIALGDNKVQIPGAGGHATLSPSNFATSKLKWVRGPVQVLINIYTARLKNSDNLLNCDVFEDDIAKLQAAPQTLRCKLIYEDD